MSIDTLFDIKQIEKSNDVIWAQINLVQDHPVYRSHFPGYPITPGVLMIMIVRHVLEQVEGKDVVLSFVKRCKYHKKVFPGDSLRVKLIVSQQIEGKHDINVIAMRDTEGDDPLFSMRASYVTTNKRI